MVSRKRVKKADIFEILVTPPGKGGQPPNITFRYRSVSPQLFSSYVTLPSIPKLILKYSKNIREIKSKNRNKWEKNYLSPRARPTSPR